MVIMKLSYTVVCLLAFFAISTAKIAKYPGKVHSPAGRHEAAARGRSAVGKPESARSKPFLVKPKLTRDRSAVGRPEFTRGKSAAGHPPEAARGRSAAVPSGAARGRTAVGHSETTRDRSASEHPRSRLNNKAWAKRHPEASGIELEMRKDLVREFREELKEARHSSSLDPVEKAEKTMEIKENLKETLKSVHSASGSINKAEKNVMKEARRRIGHADHRNSRVGDHKLRIAGQRPSFTDESLSGRKRKYSKEIKGDSPVSQNMTIDQVPPRAKEDFITEVDTKLRHQIMDIMKSDISYKEKKHNVQKLRLAYKQDFEKAEKEVEVITE